MHALDNLEMSADDAVLTAGTIPLPFTNPFACENGLGATRVVGRAGQEPLRFSCLLTFSFGLLPFPNFPSFISRLVG
jgi:hypothetical protein